MLASLIAALLLQAAPDAAPKTAAPASLPSLNGGLPKDDYSLVAWCHGALAGQLELDPIAHADMEKIEGHAKVAARAKDDAEMVKERRGFLKDYEHALAAAEAASPIAIHQQGVQAELRGFHMWNETRNKAPIWRMLDWGMWDPNDAGCNDAAKRLYDKSKLFGVALKNNDDAPGKADAPVEEPAPAARSGDDMIGKLGARPAPKEAPATAAITSGDTAPAAAPAPSEEPAPTPPASGDAAPAPAPAKKSAKAAPRKPAKAKPVETAAAAPPTQPEAAPAAEPTAPVPAAPVSTDTSTAKAEPAPAAPPEAAKKPAKVAKAAAPKKPAAPTKKKLSMDSSAEEIRAAIAAGKAATEAPAATPAPSAEPALRGPQ